MTRLALLVALAATLRCGFVAAFTTTLHGGANEDTPVGTVGAATLLRQPWLTEYDVDVRKFCSQHLYRWADRKDGGGGKEEVENGATQHMKDHVCSCVCWVARGVGASANWN